MAGVEAVALATARSRDWQGSATGWLEGNLTDYSLDLDSVASYPPAVVDEVRAGVSALRTLPMRGDASGGFGRSGHGLDAALGSNDPVARDQAVWALVRTGAAAIPRLADAVRTAPTTPLAVSALHALSRVARPENPESAAAFEDLLGDSSLGIDVREWASMLHRECTAGSAPAALERYGEPVSERDYVHLDDRTFDLTMPLLFQGQAVTRVGPATVRADISPTRFSRVFGDAMACIRSETFESNLVLEKCVPDMHADGSPHYEHFPFSGTSHELAPGAWHHNYWANIHRPFYTSGKVEQVSPRSPVIRSVPMTFCRVAVTSVPDKYVAAGRPLPESVRGIFFGFGQVSVRAAIAKRMSLDPGDFQICSRLNPATGREANTYFFGTFFGKLSDTDEHGRLVLNQRPTHCTPEGRLDYFGDGTLAPDPVRPEDW